MKMTNAVVAEWETPEDLLRVARAVRERGYLRLDAYTPFPVHGLSEALGQTRSKLTWIVFPFSACGLLGAYLLQWWCNAVDYPINVGGRPPNAILAFIIICFELTVLATGLAAFFTTFVLARLPHLTHPVFDVTGFERASIDRFWLAVDAEDAKFDEEGTVRLLEELGAKTVARVRP